MKTIIIIFIILFNYINLNSQWQRCDKGLPRDEIVVAIAGYKNIVAASYTDANIYLSKDNGENWEKINANRKAPSMINSIVIINNYIFFSDDDGVYKSSDRGNSWINIQNLISKYCELCPIYYHNGIVYVGAWNELYKSTDFGLSWSRVNEVSVHKIKIIDTNLLIATYTQGAILSKTNNQAYWRWFNEGLPNRSIIALLFTLGKNFILKENDYYQIHISNDSLTKWSTIYPKPDTGLPHPQSSDLWPMITCGNTIFAGTSNYNVWGVVYSTDTCRTWKSFNYGLDDNMAKSKGPFLSFAYNEEYFFVSTKYPNSYGSIFRTKFKDCQFDTTGINAVIESPPPPPFSISPNPAGDLTTIRHGLQSGRVAIFNLLGEKIFESRIEGESPLNIDVSEWQSGVYLCVLKGGSLTLTDKIVIAR
ncbi:MAG: glycoside hydrolase, family [Ignavibacteria bacterium]|nr:glycoside hydrolase, family [Ignavibacteria bacterium]